MELNQPVTLFKVENGFILAVDEQRFIFNSMFEVTHWLTAYAKPIAEDSYDEIPF